MLTFNEKGLLVPNQPILTDLEETVLNGEKNSNQRGSSLAGKCLEKDFLKFILAMENKIEHIQYLLEEVKFFDKMAARHKAAGMGDIEFEQYQAKKEHLLIELMAEILNAGFDNFQTSRLIYSLLEKYYKPASMNGKEVKLELEDMLHEFVPA